MNAHTPPKGPQDEVAAALQTSRDLGPDYDEAIAASLTERLDSAIEARIDARLAERTDLTAPKESSARKTYGDMWENPRVIMGIIAIPVAIPLTAIAGDIMGPTGVVISWIGLLILYVLSVVGLSRD